MWSCTSLSLCLRCIVLYRSLFDVWCGILFSYLFMIPAWCDTESSVGCPCCHDSSCFVWDPFVVMLMGYSCVAMYVCIEIPFMSCCQDSHSHHVWVCVILIGVLFEWEFLQQNISWSHSCVREFSLYDSDITTDVHHHYWQHLMQRPTPSWH